VLITTDSVLDAVHRSFDDILASLEEGALSPLLATALARAHRAVLALAKADPALAEAAADVDLYLTIARNLLAPAKDDDGVQPQYGDAVPTPLALPPTLADRPQVEALLAAVDSGTFENGDDEGTVLYGAKRRVDWTQFMARGHYTKTATLVRYFRAVMWLGRADLGFQLDQPRQLRAAGLLAQALDQSGAADQLAEVTQLVDLFAGGGDDLDLPGLLAVMQRVGVKAPHDLTDPKALAKVADTLDAEGLGRPRIRSQIVESELTDPAHAMAPPFVQVLGQRFAIDSFVLSHVVYDDIVFHGKKMLRRLPSGLDVMAALGSDVATHLLRPAIAEFGYAANLAALRDVITSRPASAWEGSLYDMWLAGLRTLSRPPATGSVPEVMKRGSWAKKMLATQLASWAQLRHDTILYTQQSFSSGGGCFYPLAYVEPYPEFYAAFGHFARVAAERIGALKARTKDRHIASAIKPLVKYYQRFGAIMDQLGGLAAKELAGKPFTKAEQRFLRRTVQQHDSHDDEYMPTITWDGWYLELVYRAGVADGRALDPAPTIADVHSDGETAQTLEAATGGVDMAIIAIDNGGDRALYVGPVLTYYEFAQPASDRLDDDAWRQQVESSDVPAPGYPSWLAPYRTTLPDADATP